MSWVWLLVGACIGAIAWNIAVAVVKRVLSWIEVQNRPLYPPPDMEDWERLR